MTAPARSLNGFSHDAGGFERSLLAVQGWLQTIIDKIARRISEIPMKQPYPISVPWRDVRGEPPPKGGGVEDFDTAAAQEINQARLEHLGGLGLPLQGRSILDVGCGVGHLAQFFLKRGNRVVCLDGRAENIARLKEIYPALEAHVADAEADLSAFGSFEIVFSYGLLYHLANPVLGLRNMAAVCTDLLLLETMVCDHELPVMRLDDETKSFTQALGGLGCRPSPSFVVMALNRLGFPFVYAPKSPPKHADFQIRWENSLAWRQNDHPIRCVFIASRKELSTAGITEICHPERAGPEPAVPKALRMKHRISLQTAVLACEQATIEQATPLKVITAPEQWSYAAAIPLAMDNTGERRLAVQIEARVLEGEIGFGVLAREERSFLVEIFSKPSAEATTITLLLPTSTDLGRLIIRNGAPGGTVSKVIVDEVGVWEAEATTSDSSATAPGHEQRADLGK